MSGAMSQFWPYVLHLFWDSFMKVLTFILTVIAKEVAVTAQSLWCLSAVTFCDVGEWGLLSPSVLCVFRGESAVSYGNAFGTHTQTSMSPVTCCLIDGPCSCHSLFSPSCWESVCGWCHIWQPGPVPPHKQTQGTRLMLSHLYFLFHFSL